MIEFVAESAAGVESSRGGVINVPMLSDIDQDSGREVVDKCFGSIARLRLKSIPVRNAVKQIRMKVQGPEIEQGDLVES